MTTDNSSYFNTIRKQSAFDRASAFVITHPKKKGYATVKFAFPKDGAGRLSVFIEDGINNSEFKFSMGTAGGYGYDKKTAALRGLLIDGIEFTDHCGVLESDKAMCKRILKAAQGISCEAAKALLKGKARAYHFSNWTSEGPASIYRKPGLEVLEAFGYSIIQAL
jgi:hypothetical protein